MNVVPGTICSRNECTYRKHIDKQNGICLFSAQLMGGGVLLWLFYIGGTPEQLTD
ncbi:MAG: hypothetical protein P4L34_09750 [Paludibacter sp.]|nr:hypothetical protein [Paludibacter sp.]